MDCETSQLVSFTRPSFKQLQDTQPTTRHSFSFPVFQFFIFFRFSDSRIFIFSSFPIFSFSQIFTFSDFHSFIFLKIFDPENKHICGGLRTARIDPSRQGSIDERIFRPNGPTRTRNGPTPSKKSKSGPKKQANHSLLSALAGPYVMVRSMLAN